MRLGLFVSQVLLLAGFLGFSTSALAVEIAPEAHHSWSFKEAGLIPIQTGGRVKPLDSVARELMLFETGSRFFEKWDPVDLLLSWMAFPREWEEKPFLQISREDVRRQLGLDDKRTRFSPGELISNFALAQYADRFDPASKDKDPRQQELRRVFERISAYRGVVSGETWTMIPPKPEAGEGAHWLALSGSDPQGDAIRSQFAEMVHEYQNGNQDGFERASGATRAAVEKQMASSDSSVFSKIKAELLYNRTHPFLMAWILYLAAALLWVFKLTLSSAQDGHTSKVWSFLATLGTVLAVSSHIYGFALRCYIAGRPPVTNMYESIVWVSLGIVAFATVIYFFQKQFITLAVACFLATLGLVAADSAPAMMDPGIHPLVPVLRSNYWLTIHVLTITLGYAAFALTLGIANVTLFQYLRQRQGFAARVLTLNQLTYRAMQFGVVFLAAGTILGGIWADYSWGRFWGWDPKEVWALIALLCYLAILHGRYTAWVGQFGYAVWTVIAFLSVVMAWYGVNFVLGVGLHSYGFSSGGQSAVAGFAGTEILYVAVVTAVYKSRKKIGGGGPERTQPAPSQA